jgi:hypothetical protein
MDSGGSFSPGGGHSFDLETQAGIMHLMASVRASELSAEQKNELRDLIFLYSNGGRDESVRITLNQKIAAFGVVPVAAPKKAQAVEENIYPFGSSRATPAFVVAQKQQATAVPQPASAQHRRLHQHLHLHQHHLHLHQHLHLHLQIFP